MKACTCRSEESKQTYKGKEYEGKAGCLKLVRFSDIPLHKPSVKVKATKDSFTIDTGHYTYDIDFNRCNTVNKIMRWMEHLSQKRWMSAKMLNTFVQLSLRRLGYEINT